MRLFIVLSALSAVALGRPGYDHEPEVHHHYTQLYHGPPAPLGHDGRVVDTPEVVNAKAAHFHAYNEELSKVSHHVGGPVYHEPEPVSYHEHIEPQQQHQEPVVVMHHASPAIHHSVYQHEPDDHHHDYVYRGPPAPLAHDGRVIDTPEVAHAKAAHFNAYAEELSKVVHKGPALYRHQAAPVHHQQDLHQELGYY